ncbi:hypothetical protein GUJ93_ZPchr0008g13992 [Zizania palustris]|uniref:GIR1-like zinc ribbon domain-containing protein n=1 Tax=Zizania palustris TaxID=103762 RepID=A0A8J5R507_ZIZPA|nr:hypothetical protein GUJ93_ZPchr0008g13992 [Zizania palustris]
MSLTRSRVEAAASVESPASSCLSSDIEGEAAAVAAMVMVVAGCPQCLMYVMLAVSEEDMKQPRCPRCNSPVLLHFHSKA